MRHRALLPGLARPKMTSLLRSLDLLLPAVLLAFYCADLAAIRATEEFRVRPFRLWRRLAILVVKHALTLRFSPSKVCRSLAWASAYGQIGSQCRFLACLSKPGLQINPLMRKERVLYTALNDILDAPIFPPSTFPVHTRFFVPKTDFGDSALLDSRAARWRTYRTEAGNSFEQGFP